MELKIGAAYVRVSTDDQLEYSPDSQLKLIREYAKRDGYIIPDEHVYKDDGISGKSADKRPAFRLMIATAKDDNPPFNCIFVWKYSRFARNQEEAIMYKNLLRKKKIEVKSISEPSSDSPFSSLIERIIEWMDEYYLINLSSEVKRGMKEKSMRGEANGKAPFGYSVKDKTYTPNEDADLVRYIYQQFAAGKSYRAIASELQGTGFKNVSGYELSGKMIKYILKNPVYVGKIRWDENGESRYYSDTYFANLSELPDGKHEPIISMELWNEVQTRLKDRGQRQPYQREGHPPFMLKGLLRCSNCGSTLIDTTGKVRPYYRKLQCCGYGSGKCKVSHFISMDRANEAVIGALEEVIQHNAFTFAPKAPPQSKIVRDWDKLIGQEETRLKRARTALLDGAFSSDEYKEIKASVEDNISKLKAAKSKDQVEEIDIEAYKKKTIEILSIIKSPDIDEGAKNMALRSIIEKIIFKKLENTFEIYFLP